MGNEGRHYPRFPLENLENAAIFFEVPAPDSALQRALFNVSYHGIGFKTKPGDEMHFKAGHKVRARLVLMDLEIPVIVTIVFVRDDMGGGKIDLESPGDIHKIIRFINPMELGLSLHQVDEKILRQPDPKRKMTWYVGRNNTEIVVWRTLSGQVSEIRALFFIYALKIGFDTGPSANPGLNSTLQTGKIDPVEMGYAPIHEAWPNAKSHWDQKLDPKIIQFSFDVIINAPHLKALDRDELYALLVDAREALGIG